MPGNSCHLLVNVLCWAYLTPEASLCVLDPAVAGGFRNQGRIRQPRREAAGVAMRRCATAGAACRWEPCLAEMPEGRSDPCRCRVFACWLPL